MKRTEQNGCCIVALHNAGHMGRVGFWVMMSAE